MLAVEVGGARVEVVVLTDVTVEVVLVPTTGVVDTVVVPPDGLLLVEDVEVPAPLALLESWLVAEAS